MIVVAGVITREGKVLIGQRQARDRHAFKWEFPGGKVELGEEPPEALKRELTEELGIDATVDEEFARYEHRAGNRPPMLLVFYRVRRFTGEPRPIAFETIRWAPPRALRHYDLLDGDIDLVQRIIRGSLKL